MYGIGRSQQERASAEARRAQDRARRETKAKEKADADEKRRVRMMQDANAQLTRANEIYERYHSETIHYANVIILLGYGGFFALWSSLAGKMPRGLFGIAGILIGMSLLFFLIFELTKIGVSSWALDAAEKQKLDGQHTLGYLNSALQKVNKWWRWAFVPSVLAGLTAGGIVLWAYVANAMQGPWTP